MKEHFFLLHLWPFFSDFFLQTQQKCYITFAVDGSSFLKVIDEQNTLCIPKYKGQNLACLCLSLVALNSFHLLLSTHLTTDLTLEWSGGPCFIHCSIFTQKLLFVALKQLQTMLWIVNALLILIDCEQMQHPLWAQLSHRKMFMQNGEYTAFWYLQLLCYLMQLQFTINQNEFGVFCVF